MFWLAVIGIVVWRLLANQQTGVLTVERKAFLRHALHWTDTAKLEKAAKLFDKAGLPDQAKLLRNRIQLRKQPKQVLQAREQVLKKALSSTDPNQLESFAKLFADQGATNTAELLQQLALGLRAAAGVQPVVIKSPDNPPAPTPAPAQVPAQPVEQAPDQTPDSNSEVLNMVVTPSPNQPPQPPPNDQTS